MGELQAWRGMAYSVAFLQWWLWMKQRAGENWEGLVLMNMASKARALCMDMVYVYMGVFGTWVCVLFV